MGIIRVMEYETDRPDEIRRLGEAQRDRMPAQGGVRVAMASDRDHTNRYVTIVEVPSSDAGRAMTVPPPRRL